MKHRADVFMGNCNASTLMEQDAFRILVPTYYCSGPVSLPAVPQLSDLADRLCESLTSLVAAHQIQSFLGRPSDHTWLETFAQGKVVCCFLHTTTCGMSRYHWSVAHGHQRRRLVRVCNLGTAQFRVTARKTLDETRLIRAL